MIEKISEDFKPLCPCPFCGTSLQLVENERFLFECKCSAFPMFTLKRLNWNNAYWWDRIQDLESKLALAVETLENIKDMVPKNGSASLWTRITLSKIRGEK